MIDRINGLLAEMGSIFRTEDGQTLVAHIGRLTFLRRSFDSANECLQFVEAAVSNQKYDFKNNFRENT